MCAFKIRLIWAIYKEKKIKCKRRIVEIRTNRIVGVLALILFIDMLNHSLEILRYLLQLGVEVFSALISKKKIFKQHNFKNKTSYIELRSGSDIVTSANSFSRGTRHSSSSRCCATIKSSSWLSCCWRNLTFCMLSFNETIYNLKNKN